MRVLSRENMKVSIAGSAEPVITVLTEQAVESAQSNSITCITNIELFVDIAGLL